MTAEITLREVQESDLPLFFEFQLDPEATRMAAFPSRTHEVFMAKWAKNLADPEAIIRTILYQGRVAGSIVYWQHQGEARLGYWLGRAYWGQGIASAAVAEFVGLVPVRPLYARVAKHNIASIRVLEKCGFIKVGEGKFSWTEAEEGEEFVMRLDDESDGI